MGDDSRRRSIVDSLKNEWSLLWESIAGDGEEEGTPENENSFENGQVRVLSLEDIRRLTRDLSHGRRTLNQRLESLHKELELNTAKLESLRLVGGEDEATVRKINELSEQGQRLSNELSQLDEKLKLARTHEDKIRRRLTAASSG